MSKARNARILELERQIEDFRRLANEAKCAGDSGQFAAAVSALGKAAVAADELANIQAMAEGREIKDPVKRLEYERDRASAAGSWQAVAFLGKAIEEARAKQAAEQAEREERERRAILPEEKARRLGDALVALPAKLRQIALARLNLGDDARAN